MIFNNYAKGLCALMTSALLVACGGDSSSDNDASGGADKTVTVNFAPKLNSTDLVCGANTETVGTAQTAPTFNYFGLYISDVQVATDSGEFVSLALSEGDLVDASRGITLITNCGSQSVATSETNTNLKVVGTAADADYSRLRFTIGVPETHNHLDAANTEGLLAKSIGMHWNWTKGYKHAKMDVAGWNIHVGSTACNGTGTDDPNSVCSNGNRPTYTFDNVDFDQQRVILDYADLVSTSDISQDTGGAPGCMSGGTDPECGAIFTALGLDLATGSCKDSDCDTQTWVTVQ